jgi:hypothetical protein
MANRKIVLDPSKWIVDEDHKVGLRYRIVTNDLNVRSAFSPLYRVSVPSKEDLFSAVSGSSGTSSSNGSTSITVSWTTEPIYNNFNYYIFVKKPGETDYSFVKSTQDTSFSFVTPSANVGEYSILVSMPTTTKQVLTNATLFVATQTI